MRPHHLGKLLCIRWKAGHKMPPFIANLAFFFPPRIDKSYRLYCLPSWMALVQPLYIIAYRIVPVFYPASFYVLPSLSKRHHSQYRYGDDFIQRIFLVYFLAWIGDIRKISHYGTYISAPSFSFFHVFTSLWVFCILLCWGEE